MAFVVLGRGVGRVARSSIPSARFGSSLVFSQHGKPSSVLSLDETPTPSPTKGQVVVKMLAASVSLGDVDQILGSAPGSAPGVAGSSGVGIVEAVSAGSSLSVGDHVIPNSAAFGGTWRSHAVVSEDLVDKIPSSLTPELGATLGLGPCTAFCLLNEFASLKEGDVIVQNDAGSQVGEAVIQLAALKGIKTINVAKTEQVENLKKLGGTVVVDEEGLRSSEFSKSVSSLPKPKLALNGAGGITATDISRLLSSGGTFVTYGNSSRSHLKITPSSLIFNDIEFRGFNISSWVATHSKEERGAMVSELSGLVESGKVKLSLETVSFGEWEKAVEKAVAGGSVVLLL